MGARSWFLFSSKAIGGSHTAVTNVTIEENQDTNKDGRSKKEDKTSASEEINSTKGIAEIKVKDGMTEIKGLFIAIAQLDPSIKLENKASPANANKKIHDADAPGPILQESAGQLLKLTTLDNDPIDVNATIHIPTDVDDMASCDNEVTFIIPQEQKGVYGQFTGVDKFLQKDPKACNARYAVETAFGTQPKTVGYGRLIFIVATIGTKIFDLHCLLTIQVMVTISGNVIGENAPPARLMRPSCRQARFAKPERLPSQSIFCKMHEGFPLEWRQKRRDQDPPCAHNRRHY